MEHTYTVSAALTKLRSHGAHVSRNGYYRFIHPKLVACGVAKEVAPQVWRYAEPELSHWSEYIALVQKRKEAGTLPGNYEYNEMDCWQAAQGEWDA